MKRVEEGRKNNRVLDAFMTDMVDAFRSSEILVPSEKFMGNEVDCTVIELYDAINERNL